MVSNRHLPHLSAMLACLLACVLVSSSSQDVVRLSAQTSPVAPTLKPNAYLLSLWQFGHQPHCFVLHFHQRAFMLVSAWFSLCALEIGNSARRNRGYSGVSLGTWAPQAAAAAPLSKVSPSGNRSPHS